MDDGQEERKKGGAEPGMLTKSLIAFGITIAGKTEIDHTIIE